MFSIIPLYFVISLLCSFFILYISAPCPQIVIKYPNIKDDESQMYVDDKGVCYKYKKKEIKCPNQKTN